MPEPVRDVVVVIPGILGSVLEKDGKEIWGLSARAGLRGLLTAGGSIRSLTLDGDSPTEPFLDDGVRATKLINDLHLIPGLWKIDGYGRIADVLRANLALEDGVNFFSFPYDWRRDIRSAALRLRKATEQWLAERRKTFPDAKLVLLCHSMGGLVARAFLHGQDGWRDTRLVVTFGTPFRGSLNPIDYMANGFKKKFAGITLVNLTGMARSLTGLYQMMAAYDCIDLGDGKFRRVSDVTDLPGIDAARAAEGIKFLDGLKEAAAANVATEEYRQHGPLLVPVAGVFQRTNVSALLDGGTLRMMPTLGAQDVAGDGTVPRPSATPHELERQGREVYMAEAHSKLQNWDPTIVQIEGAITAGDIDWVAFQRPEVRHGVDVDDMYAAGEPVEFEVGSQDTSLDLSVTVRGRETGAPSTTTVPAGEEWRRVRLDPLPEDTYDVEVADQAGAGKPVSDVFVVASESVEG
jgi:pimeloyl-ACP methyl ester carboxylesterase